MHWTIQPDQEQEEGKFDKLSNNIDFLDAVLGAKEGMQDKRQQHVEQSFAKPCYEKKGADKRTLAAAAGAEEDMQDSREQFNETGVPIEPFNLDREREKGQFDAGGGYIPNNFPQVKDAWLDSIDGLTTFCQRCCFSLLHAYKIMGTVQM